MSYENASTLNGLASIGWAYALCYGAGAATNAYAHGASTSDALTSGVKAGVIAFISQWAFKQAGDTYQNSTWAAEDAYAAGEISAEAANSALASAQVGHVLTHAMLGGVLSVLQGGKFGNGFAAAGFTQAVGPVINEIPGPMIGRVAAAAIVGGTASVMTGGKFGNGAVTAAFSAAFSEAGRTRRQSSPTQEENNPLNVVGDVAGKIWTAPNTIIGAIFGGIGHIFWGIGYALGFYSVSPSVSIGNNAIQFLHNPFMLEGTAITLGNTISYGRNAHPDYYGAYGDSTVQIGRHEQAHTYQYQVLGPLFLPAYFLRGGISGPGGNPFELAAQRYGRGGGEWWQ